MSRHASILHRGPRTRRGRMLARLQGVRHDIVLRSERRRRRRRRHAAGLRAQELFRHLEQMLGAEPAEPAAGSRRVRLHVRAHR